MKVALGETVEEQRVATFQIVPCINCGVPVEGKYCSSCGQRKAVSKITWRSLGQEFTAKWLGFDNQLGRTFLDLTIKPGKVIHAYLGGNRVTYLGPLGYYFIVSALVLLGMSLLEVSIEDFMKTSSSDFSTTAEQPSGRVAAVQQQVFHYMSSLFRFMVILFVPFFAYAASLFFRRKGFSFLEHAVMLMYSSAHLFFISLFQAIIFKIMGETYTSFSAGLSLLYYGCFYSSAMGAKFSFKNFFKGIGVVAVGYAMFIFLMMFVLLVALLIFG
jgi:hypothetical protein